MPAFKDLTGQKFGYLTVIERDLLRVARNTTWENMVQRCTNSRATKYRLHGGRGIRVCDRWLNFREFFDDMGKKPAEKTLERIENNGNYEPGNCKGATREKQAKNHRF